MALLNASLFRILTPQVQTMNIRVLSLFRFETYEYCGTFRRVQTALRFPVYRFILFGVLGLLVGCDTSPESQPKKAAGSETPPSASQSATSELSKTEGPIAPVAEKPVEQVVRVKIQRGDGAEVLEGTVPWTEGLTVFDALSGVSPPIAVESTGQGEALFVKSIAGQANLGSAGDNWIYRVNGQLGDCSSGIYELEAGDEVLWSFGKYE